MSRDMTHQRLGAVSNSQVGQDFEAHARQFFASQGIDLESHHKIKIGASDVKKDHKFDLGWAMCRARLTPALQGPRRSR